MGGFVVQFLVAAAFQFFQARQQRARQKKAERDAKRRADAAKGFTVTTEGESAELPVCYGRNLVGGVRVSHDTKSSYIHAAPAANGLEWANGLTKTTGGSKHEFLFVQQAICIGGISAIHQIEIDGRLYSDAKFNSYGAEDPEQTGEIPGRGSLRLHTYTDGGTADPMVTANVPSRSSALFKGAAFLSGVFRINRDNYQFGGVPDIKVYLEGAKVRTIIGTEGNRQLSSVKTYSNNPALCLLDYLTNEEYGRGLPVSFINLETFYNASVICDREVQTEVPSDGLLWQAKGGVKNIKLYECNISLSTSKHIRENIEILLETMGQAELTWSDGQYKLSLHYPDVFDRLGIGTIAYPLGAIIQHETTPSSKDLFISTAAANVSDPLVADWDRTVVASYIGDDDIIRDKEVTASWPNAQTRYNQVIVKFLNEARDFSEDSVSWPPKTGTIDGAQVRRGTWDGAVAYNKSDVVDYTPTGLKYQLADGYERVSATDPVTDPAWILFDESLVYNQYMIEDNHIPLASEFFEAGITTYYHALAKAEQRCRSSRAEVVYKFSVSFEHSHIEPGDIVKVDSVVLGIPGELMRVEDVKAHHEGFLELGCVKFDARVLAWNAKDDEVVSLPNLFLAALPQVTGLTFSDTGTTYSLSAGKLFWTRPDDNRINSYKVLATPGNVVPSLTTVWETLGITSNTSFDVPSLYTGDWTFAVVSMSGSTLASFVNSISGDTWPYVSSAVTAVEIGGVTLMPIQVYMRTSGIPSTPSGGAFDFDTLQLAPAPAGWSSGIPVGVDALYVSQTVAETTGGTGVDSTLIWSAPELFSDPQNRGYLNTPVAGVLQDSSGVNYDYTSAVGNYVVIVGSLDVSDASAYSVISETNCAVTVDPLTGAYSVTSLTGDLGTAVIRAVYDTLVFDAQLTVVSLKSQPLAYLDTPPTPSGVTVTTGFNNIYVSLAVQPSYGGGAHDVTEIWLSDDAIEANAVLVESFKGTEGTYALGFGNTKYMWIYNRSVAGVKSLGYVYPANPIATGFIGTVDMGPLIVSAEKLANNAVNEDKLAVGAIAAGSLAVEYSAIENAMIADLTADKLRGGTILATEEILVGGNLKISGAGWIESYAVAPYSYSGDFARFDAGNVSLHTYVPSLGTTVESAFLTRIETGVAFNGVLVTIPGYFKTEPRVVVSGNSLQVYDATYAAQSQTAVTSPGAVTETSAGSMIWQFTPTATLMLASATVNENIGLSSGSIPGDLWTSASQFLPANSTSVTANLSFSSVRGTTTAGIYYYRSVRTKIQYWNGSTWVDAAAWAVTNLDSSGSGTKVLTFDFPSAGAWEYRVVMESYDTGGTFGSATGYNYDSATLDGTLGDASVSFSGENTVSDYYESRPGLYTPPAGWSVWNVTYTFAATGSASVGGSADTLQATASVTSPTSNTMAQALASGPTNDSGSWSNQYTEASYTNKLFKIKAYGKVIFGTGLSGNASATATMTMCRAVIDIREPITQSTVPTNIFNFDTHSYDIATSTVLATGSLNWMAIGR